MDTLCKILILLQDEKIYAQHISDERISVIPFLGKDSFSLKSKSDVDTFIEILCEENSIDELSELDMDIFMFYTNADKGVLKYLIEKLNQAEVFGACSLEKLLPVAASRVNITDDDPAVIQLNDCLYKLSCNKSGVITTENTSEGEPVLKLTTPDLCFVFSLNKNLFSDSNAAKELEKALKDLDKYKESLKALETEKQKLTKQNKALEKDFKEISSKSESAFEELRIIKENEALKSNKDYKLLYIGKDYIDYKNLRFDISYTLMYNNRFKMDDPDDYFHMGDPRNIGGVLSNMIIGINTANKKRPSISGVGLDINKGDTIGKLYSSSEEIVNIKSPCSGKMFCLLSDAKSNIDYPELPFAIIADKDKSYDDVISWFREAYPDDAKVLLKD